MLKSAAGKIPHSTKVKLITVLNTAFALHFGRLNISDIFHYQFSRRERYQMCVTSINAFYWVLSVMSFNSYGINNRSTPSQLNPVNSFYEISIGKIVGYA